MIWGFIRRWFHLMWMLRPRRGWEPHHGVTYYLLVTFSIECDCGRVFWRRSPGVKTKDGYPAYVKES